VSNIIHNVAFVLNFASAPLVAKKTNGERTLIKFAQQFQNSLYTTNYFIFFIFQHLLCYNKHDDDDVKDKFLCSIVELQFKMKIQIV
jgi:formate-dependent nitrite reductase membrane component NrfD